MLELAAISRMADEVLGMISCQTQAFSLVRELDTMVSDAGWRAISSIAEILIYPTPPIAYGELKLTPDQPALNLTAQQNVDSGRGYRPMLAERLGFEYRR